MRGRARSEGRRLAVGRLRVSAETQRTTACEGKGELGTLAVETQRDEV